MNKLLAGLILTPWLPLVAQAQAQAPRLDTLQLSAAASMEVARDTLMLSFATTKEGSDAAQLQNQLKKALDEALVEARKIARPGQVEVQAGNLSLYPRYGQVKTASGSQNQLTGWQGTVEMQVQGRDMAAISQLSGALNSPVHAMYGTTRYWSAGGMSATDWLYGWAAKRIDEAPVPEHY